MENPLGETIHRLRKERGWSTSALARRAGISTAEISRLEKGQGTGPSWRTLEGLAKAFSLSVSELTAGVPRAPEDNPIIMQQVEGLIRGVEENKISADMALTIMEQQGILKRRPHGKTQVRR
jgi:transcriptional regulator with XRE-family HTH domain